MERINSNAYSHLTAKERDAMSFPAKYLLSREMIKGDVLDFGCGLGKDVEELNKEGISIEEYDPFYAPQFPKRQYDCILCFYVLNVLLPEEQMDVLMNVSSLLKPYGLAYFAVRRDVAKEGYRMHRLHNKPTYQCNVKLPFHSIFLNEFCEIYEYQHYTTLHVGNTSVSPFFEGSKVRELIVESAMAFSFYDKYPVSLGHTLIVPKRLLANYFELTVKEQMACWLMVNKVKEILTERFVPDGFNVGINVNEAAGQTMFHVHIHVIPRYVGDVEKPRGGVRGVIGEKKEC